MTRRLPTRAGGSSGEMFGSRGKLSRYFNKYFAAILSCTRFPYEGNADDFVRRVAFDWNCLLSQKKAPSIHRLKVISFWRLKKGSENRPGTNICLLRRREPQEVSIIQVCCMQRTSTSILTTYYVYVCVQTNITAHAEGGDHVSQARSDRPLSPSPYVVPV